MQIQWYPGHMTKAVREIQNNLKVIDLFVEIVDARIPSSSTNPDLNRILKEKKKVVVMNKADLADPRATAAWQKWYESRGIPSIAITAVKADDIKRLKSLLLAGAEEKFERDRKRGLKPRPFRAVVSGIPNVGKSTVINSLKGKAAAKTGNKPGVTKGEQWIRIGKEFDLLDTPGILWPKFEDRRTGVLLSLFGSVKDEIVDMNELAAEACSEIIHAYPGLLAEKYGLDESLSGTDMISQFAEMRNYLKKGGVPDYDRAALTFVNEVRAGKTGRITLELPELSKNAD